MVEQAVLRHAYPLQRARLGRQTVTCAKVAFESKLQAHWAILTIWKGNAKSGKTGKVPVRAYPCAACFKWHLTSQEDGTRRSG